MSAPTNLIDPPAVDAPDIVASVVAYLGTVSQVVAIMGAGHAARIRPGAVPTLSASEARKPCIVARRLDTRRTRVLRGKRQNLARSFVQVDVWAKTDQIRTNLADAVRNAMTPERFHGQWLGLEIRDLSCDSDGDSSEDAADGSEERDWRCLFRFSIWHRNLTEV
jgi:hypothetical protein